MLQTRDVLKKYHPFGCGGTSKGRVKKEEVLVFTFIASSLSQTNKVVVIKNTLYS